jgi:hypothetical protein
MERKMEWFTHPVYTVGSFFLAVAVFFLVPLPWHFALLTAIGTYFATILLAAIMVFITDLRAERELLRKLKVK